MSEFLQFVLALIIIILAAKAGGYVSVRLGQPSVLGELVVGLLLGPTVLDFLHLPFFTDEHLSGSITHLAELGVLWLMFVAGLELHFSELLKSTRVAALAGSLGVVVPLLLGAATALLFDLDTQPALFVGLILSATSVSISAQTLIELDVLRSRVGLGLLGAAVFDDILVILFLSIFVALGGGGDAGGLAAVVWTVLRMAGYLVVATGVGLWLLPRLLGRAANLPVSQSIITFAILVGLLYAWAAEVLGGMAAITGAFLAGLFLARTPLRPRIEQGMSVLAYALFVPIFLVNIGLQANARALDSSGLFFTLVISVGAVLGKVIGCGLGARLGGFSKREAVQLGVGMVSRGEVGLIVASVGLVEGLISPAIFAAIVVMVIITTLLTPPLLRASFRHSPAPPQRQPAQKSE